MIAKLFRKKTTSAVILCLVLTFCMMISGCGSKSAGKSGSGSAEPAENQQETEEKADSGGGLIGIEAGQVENTATFEAPDVEVADSGIVGAEAAADSADATTASSGGGIVGLDNVIQKQPVEIGGVLASLSEEDAAAIKDSLDEEEIAEMSSEEQQELITNMGEIVDKHQKVLVLVQDKLEEADADVEIDEETGKITMDNSILFKKGEYKLSDAGKKSLDEFFSAYGEAILDKSVSSYVSQIQVIGNASSEGDYNYNKTLSQNRAKEVMNYCLNSKKMGWTKDQKKQLKGKMKAIGVSSDNPVLDKNGKEDKKASRRVEFKFIMNIDTDSKK